MKISDDDESGFDLIHRARMMSPEDPYPLQMLAAIHADRKAPAEAIENAQRALELTTDPRQRATMAELVVEMQRLQIAERSRAASRAG